MDYYLEDPTRLKGQPKRTIADYVEQNGILVPRRFDTLVEARKSHKGILVRSEHRQDYDGVSGLLDSFRLNSCVFPFRGASTLEEIKEMYFKSEDLKHGDSKYSRYCRYLNINEHQFKSEMSFSIWEYISGLNITVAADSSIRNSYHILTKGDYNEKELVNYCVVDEGKIIKQFMDQLPNELILGLPSLLALYERIRQLDKFNPNSCPIMEFQKHKDKIYFLQYHKGRDFLPSQFTLERALGKGEFEAPFVRGATPEQGVNAKVVLEYYGLDEGNASLVEHEEGAYDLHHNKIFIGLMVRRRDIQMIHLDKSFISNSGWLNYVMNFKFAEFSCGHSVLSQLFKPGLSVIHNINDIIGEQEREQAYDLASQTKQNQCIDIFVISDGRKAYIKRV